MKSTLNGLEAVTIYAFVDALAKQDKALPPDLQQQINQVGELFADNPQAAANRLLELAEDQRIKLFYEESRLEIQRQYEPGEQNRYISLDDEPDPSGEPQPETLENLMAVTLQSPEPEKEAKKLSSKLKILFSQRFRQKK